MSDIFNSFDSNGAGGDDSQDILMASPSQSSPMANNSNSNSTGVLGGISQTVTNNASGSSAAGTANSNTKTASGAESQPIRKKLW